MKVRVCYVAKTKSPHDQVGRVVHVFHEGDEIGPGELGEGNSPLACTDWLEVDAAELEAILCGKRVCGERGVTAGVDRWRRDAALTKEIEEETDPAKCKLAEDELRSLRGGA